MSQPVRDPINVAIIGAGVSGLRCADILLRSGAKVKVYEARDRIGGRVHQIQFGGHLVDLGANWIHSPNENPIKTLSERAKVITMARPKDQAVVGSDGRRRSDDVALRLHAKRLEVIGEACTHSLEHRGQIDPDVSLMDFFRDKIDRDFRDEPAMRRDMLNEAQRWGQMVGEPVDQQSLKFLCIDEGHGGTDLFVANSYKDIITLIGEPILEANAVQFGAEVMHISSSPAAADSSVTVETSDGARNTFDEVVVTCPLGWLKENKDTAFTPALPSRLRQAIENINYGRLEKLYITFPTAWWLEYSEDTVTNPHRYPVFTHFHDPTYVGHPSEIPCNLVAISLAHLPGPTASPTLLFYMHGPCTTQLISSLDNHNPNSDAYNSILELFAHPYYSRMPNYSPENPSCKPVSYLCTSWQLDRLAGRGSYSHFRKGVANAVQDVEVIRDAGGLGESNGVWLAGEHTAPFGVMATTTGAYISGELVAERICRKRGLQARKDADTEGPASRL